MDSQTLMVVGTLLLGLVGAAIFFVSQPAPVKKRSAGAGLKPRGELHMTPRAIMLRANHPRAIMTHCSQRISTRNERC